MEREKTDEQFQLIRQMAHDDPAILAFFVTGSRAVGFANEHSDYDCALVVEDDALGRYEYRFEGYEPEIETEIFTLESFQAHAAWDSDLAWELAHFPLTKLRIPAAEFEADLLRILTDADRRTQQKLLVEMESLFRSEGYSEIFDGWQGKDRWAMAYNPTAEGQT